MQSQDVIKFIRILQKWWWVSALLLGATLAAILVIVLTKQPLYQAAVTIQLSAPPPQEVPLFSEFGRQGLLQEIEQTRASLAEFMQAGDLAFRVLERLPNVDMSERELNDQIELELPDTSQLITVRVRAPDRELAALLANSVAEVGLERYAQLLAQPTTRTREFIEQQLSVAEAQLREAETNLEQFRLTHKVFDLDQTIDDQTRLLLALRQSSDAARTGGNAGQLPQLQQISLEREAELQALIQLAPEYNALLDRVKQARSSTNFLQEKRNEAQIKENQILAMSSIQIINTARPPRQALPGLSNSMIIFGIVSGLIASMLLALLLEFLETSGLFGTPRLGAQRGVVSPSLMEKFIR
jgi:uncharacterized protein involved in exopolysaccharide biosynthesis